MLNQTVKLDSNPLPVHDVENDSHYDAEHGVTEQKDHNIFPSFQLLCHLQPKAHISYNHYCLLPADSLSLVDSLSLKGSLSQWRVV